LRDRKDDIRGLAMSFLTRFAERHSKPARAIPPHVLQLLEGYDWPGNVRELQNVVERAVIVTAGPELAVEPAWLFPSAGAAETARTWAAQEKERLVAALRAAGGRIYGPGGAAQRLGLKPTTLYGKLRKHGLTRDGDGAS
ncbi:MAG: AAA family ATPase, partial [Gemmataceae bacterium]|nr:AAA family ATPase [Gemmataceae bacterium]